MKKTSAVLWGIVLIAAGVIWALNEFNIMHINIFFDGWWTLLIIVPCAIGLFTEREKTGNLFGIVIGGLLLLCCRDILSFSVLWKLLVPAIIVIVGLKLLLTGLFGNKANEIIKQQKLEGKAPKTGCAIFSGYDLNYGGEVFEGAELTAVFGGIDILVPNNVNVKVNANSIFGGVSNKTAVHPTAPTVYIGGTCIFGGVDIK